MKSHPRSRGMSLLEVIMTLGLFSVFLTLSGQVFRSSIMSMDGVAAAESGAAGIDHALAALRWDVWVSGRIEANPQSLTIQTGGNGKVKWSTGDGVLTREERHGDTLIDTREWRKMPAIAWEVSGPTVTLIVTTPHGVERVEMMAPLLTPEFHP